ncbi:MAG: hypothetical protein GY875_01475 [Gammaproteobacteria bacterium]|nr:hypothetical protein [Gammaproteobacteria bacterium]
MAIANRYHFLLLLWALPVEDAKIDAIYAQQLHALSRLIDLGKTQGSINSGLSTPWIVSLIDSLVYAGCWMIRSGEMTTAQAGEHAARVLFDGIAK